MNIHHAHARSILLLLTLFLAACGTGPNPSAPTDDVRVSITGGYDLDPRDGGRPVVLIAAALDVPAQVFREAFSYVQPATAGQEPDPEQVRRNKDALLSALGPYGVTNDLLDTVSNYYRYNGSAGETWPKTPATATAIVTDGVVTGFVITNPGSGYTSAPVISVAGSGDVAAIATISFSTDFKTNGALASITLVKKTP